MAVVCSPRHLLAGRESITLSELDGINMVGYSDDLPIRREIDRLREFKHDVMRLVDLREDRPAGRGITVNRLRRGPAGLVEVRRGAEHSQLHWHVCCPMAIHLPESTVLVNLNTLPARKQPDLLQRHRELY